MILASISGGQSLGKPFPDLSRQGQSLCEGPFGLLRKSKPFKPSDAVGFDEKSPEHPLHDRVETAPVQSEIRRHSATGPGSASIRQTTFHPQWFSQRVTALAPHSPDSGDTASRSDRL